MNKISYRLVGGIIVKMHMIHLMRTIEEAQRNLLIA